MRGCDKSKLCCFALRHINNARERESERERCVKMINIICDMMSSATFYVAKRGGRRGPTRELSAHLHKSHMMRGCGGGSRPN